MSRIAFADESGTTENPKCYAIGVLSVDEARLGSFHKAFHELKVKHGIARELHWTKISTSHGAINIALDWMYRILTSQTASFDIIVVNTAMYRNWQDKTTRENAFYTTYTLLLKDVVKKARQTVKVLIDDRSDSYEKQHEVVETIGNRMLAKLEQTGRLKDVRKVPSRDTPGVQVADLLTGAIAAAHRRHLVPDHQIHAGKVLAIERMAALLGWDDLHYDTLPNPRLNIWHFPTEYRAKPATRTVEIARAANFVTAPELRDRIARRSAS